MKELNFSSEVWKNFTLSCQKAGERYSKEYTRESYRSRPSTDLEKDSDLFEFNPDTSTPSDTFPSKAPQPLWVNLEQGFNVRRVKNLSRVRILTLISWYLVPDEPHVCFSDMGFLLREDLRQFCLESFNFLDRLEILLMLESRELAEEVVRRNFSWSSLSSLLQQMVPKELKRLRVISHSQTRAERSQNILNFDDTRDVRKLGYTDQGNLPDDIVILEGGVKTSTLHEESWMYLLRGCNFLKVPRTSSESQPSESRDPWDLLDDVLDQYPEPQEEILLVTTLVGVDQLEEEVRIQRNRTDWQLELEARRDFVVQLISDLSSRLLDSRNRHTSVREMYLESYCALLEWYTRRFAGM